MLKGEREWMAQNDANMMSILQGNSIRVIICFFL